MMRRAVRSLRAFSGDRRGVSAVEFALVAPILVVLIMGVAELGRYGIFRMKVHDAVGNLADLVARLNEAEATQIDALMATVPIILDPFDDPERFLIVVSAVEQRAQPVVAWQRTSGNLSSESSRIGQPGAEARMPQGLVSTEMPTVIAAEVMVRYDSWLHNYVVDHTAYDTAFSRPRRTTLADIR